MTDENVENQTIQIGIPLDGNSEMLFGGSILSGDALKTVDELQNKGALKFTSSKTIKQQPFNSDKIKPVKAIGPFVEELPKVEESKTKSKSGRSNKRFESSELIEHKLSELQDDITSIKNFLEDYFDSSVKSAVEEVLHERDLRIQEAKQTINLKSDSNIELQPKDAIIDIEDIASYTFQYTGATFYDDFIVLALDASQFTVNLKNANLTLELASYPNEKFQGVFLGKPFKPFPDVPYSLLVFLKAPKEDIDT